MSETLVTLELTGVIGHATEIVAEFGFDHKYAVPEDYGVCVYFAAENGEFEPSCLVGHILARYGITYKQLDSRDCNTSNIVTVFGQGYVKGDERTRAFLADLQAAQDAGDSWGRALVSALSRCVRMDTQRFEDIRYAIDHR